MSLELTLPPEVEERLHQEAERRGEPSEAVAARLLDRHLPARFAAEETERKMQSAKTLQDLFAAYEELSDADDDYDLRAALDKNRRGERPLFPPELKGVSW